MEDRQQRLLATIAAVLQLATKWSKQMSHPDVRATLNELQTTLAAIKELQARELPWRFTSVRTAQIRAWCDVLREDHMMVVASLAALHLVDATSRKPLKVSVPHRRARPDALVAWTRYIDESVRPHLAY